MKNLRFYIGASTGFVVLVSSIALSIPNDTTASASTADFRFVNTAVQTVAIAANRSSSIDDTEQYGRDLAEARAATAQFHDVEQALADGRFVLEDLAHLTCIEDPGGSGGMGEHYVNLALVLDGEIDVTQPEALLYDPSGPHPRLLGVEYVVFVADWAGSEPPTLFGHEFHLVEAGNRYGLPAFYELHAWIWDHNPSGMFEDWNPRIDCN